MQVWYEIYLCICNDSGAMRQILLNGGPCICRVICIIRLLHVIRFGFWFEWHSPLIFFPIWLEIIAEEEVNNTSESATLSNWKKEHWKPNISMYHPISARSSYFYYTKMSYPKKRYSRNYSIKVHHSVWILIIENAYIDEISNENQSVTFIEKY